MRVQVRKNTRRRFSEPARHNLSPHLILTWEFETTYLTCLRFPLFYLKMKQFKGFLSEQEGLLLESSTADATNAEKSICYAYNRWKWSGDTELERYEGTDDEQKDNETIELEDHVEIETKLNETENPEYYENHDEQSENTSVGCVFEEHGDNGHSPAVNDDFENNDEK